MTTSPTLPDPAPRVCFVSGHLDLSFQEFEEHYVPALRRELEAGSAFVVCDARGADAFTRSWLRANGTRSTPVTVFHMLDAPRSSARPFPTRGGFTSDEERDAAATAASTHDLAWVRPGREKSGTAKNLARRHPPSTPGDPSP